MRESGVPEGVPKKHEKMISVGRCFFMFYVKKVGFWDPPKNALDFEGVLKSHFFNINQHKTRKSGVPEGVPKKHDILMRNQCGKVTFQEA